MEHSKLWLLCSIVGLVVFALCWTSTILYLYWLFNLGMFWGYDFRILNDLYPTYIANTFLQMLLSGIGIIALVYPVLKLVQHGSRIDLG
jgi:hypothetical protein